MEIFYLYGKSLKYRKYEIFGVDSMKRRLIILSVSALLGLVSLAGCGEPANECPPCDECNDEGGNGGGEDNNPDDDKDPEPSDPVIDEPDPSEGLIDPADSPWSEEVTNVMSEALGGAILPFIDLGEGELDAQFIQNDEDEEYKSYLLINGEDFLASNLEEAVSTYKEHYWDALMIGESFFASNDLINVEVEVTKTYDGLFELKAFYNEPFNPSSLSEWNDETSLLLKEHLGRFEVPFVYLGTVNYESSISEEGNVTVIGGIWNDAVITEFESAFSGWQISKDVEVLTTRHATFEDGSTVNATLQKVNNKAQLTISFNEVFDATNQTSWSNEVVKTMNSSLNNTVLPYVYLGSVYPTIEEDGTSARSISLVGKLWDDSILTSADTAFKADGWEGGVNEKVATFTKTVGNLNFEVVIEQNANGLPTLRASRSEVYDPSTISEYSQEIKDEFKAKYGEDIASVIPFIYLGTAYPTLNTEFPAKHEAEDANKIVISGGQYDARILDSFKTLFSAESGWIIEVDGVMDDSGSDYGNYGDVLAVALKVVGEHTYKVGLFTHGNEGDETAYLEINRCNNTASAATKWSDESLQNVEKVLGSDVTIPFFDTGRDTLEFIFDEYGNLSIQFLADTTTFSYRVYTAIKALKDAEWTVNLTHNDTYYDSEAWINSINATKQFGEKIVRISINVTPSSYYRFSMSGTISLDETYDPSKVNGSWSEEIKNAVKEKYGIDLPYIYLGTDYPYIYENETDGTFQIRGNVLTSEIFSNARKVLEENGFTYQANESSTWYVVATIENEDGNIVTVYVDYSDSKPCISFELTEVFNPGSQTEWDEKTQEVLTNELNGVELPYMYLGTNEPTSSVEEFNFVKKISLVGGLWNDQVLSLAQANLTGTGFESNLVLASSYSSTYELQAYKVLEDNTAIRFKLFENDDDYIELDIFVDLKPENADTSVATWEEFPKAYGDSVLDAMNQYLGMELPEFVPTALLPEGEYSLSISSPWGNFYNQYVSFNSYNAYFSPYYLYLAKANLEKEGYEITFSAFAEDDMPGFTAKYVDTNGTLMINFSSYYGDFDDTQNGIRVSAIFLPSLEQFEDITDFEPSNKELIKNSLDGQDLPYVNLGVKNQEIDASNGEVTITAYNYSEEIIDNIKTKYSEAGWTIYETFIVSNGRIYKTCGGYLEANGHTYVLTVTPSISEAVNGSGTFSSDSITTELKIEMA